MKKILEYLEFLDEVAMNPIELQKPNASTNQPRSEILYNRIKMGQPIELNNGNEVVIDPIKSQTAMNVLQSGNLNQIAAAFKGGKRAQAQFVTQQGETLPLNALKKASYFGGGGGGKGGGAAQTAVQEAAQAVAMAVGAKTNQQSPDDITPQAIQRAQRQFAITTPREKILELTQNAQWAQTFANATNALYESYPSARKLVFHHGSSWIKNLEATFNRINRAEGKYFSNINKWNPSDIWAVSRDAPRPQDEVGTLVGLNAWLQEMFETGQVYGISLKKAPKNATAKRVNYHGDVDELLDVSIKDLVTSKTNKLFGSKDSYIVFEGSEVLGDFDHLRHLIEKDNLVQFRSFGGDDPIQAEIKGKHAAHGKIGHGGINKILTKYGMQPLTPRADILAQSQKSMEDTIERIIINASRVNPETAEAARDNITDIAKGMKRNLLVSKFQAVETLANVKDASPEQQTQFIQELIGLASSQAELSSVFIKIS